MQNWKHTQAMVKVAGFALVVGATAWMPLNVATAHAAEPPKDEQKTTEGSSDYLIFRDGRVLVGTIVSETATTVKFKGTAGASKIAFETEYQKNEILEIKHGKKAEAGNDAAKPTEKDAKAPAEKSDKTKGTDKPTKAVATADVGEVEGRQRYYWVNLEGEFGEQITESPLRDAMRDARKNNADVIIVSLDAKWFDQRSGEEALDALADFQDLFRAEKIMPVIQSEMPSEWAADGKKMPRLVIWVRKAMAGAAFMPLIFKEIYFDPEGTIGGIGNLSTMMKGHERVVAKQVSLRLQHAVGWFQAGEHEKRLGGGSCEKLMRAMAMPEYVLSVRYENGKPIFLERMPENPGEDLLTDDGKEERRDTLEQLARNEGNDVLTIRAPLALRIGLSSGTVATKEELLAAMGLERTGVEIKGKSEQIMKSWSKGLDDAKRDIKKLRDEFAEVRVDPPGGIDEQNKADSRRINIIDRLCGILAKYKEGLSVQWFGQNGQWMRQPWGGQNGIEGLISSLRTRQDQLRQEILKRKK
jgi:hypothetical protein